MAKVPSEVKTKLQSEKIVPKKPSPIADIVIPFLFCFLFYWSNFLISAKYNFKVGLPTYGLKRLERDQIVDMNIGQLQVIVNDLCNQIESKSIGFYKKII